MSSYNKPVTDTAAEAQAPERQITSVTQSKSVGNCIIDKSVFKLFVSYFLSFQVSRSRLDVVSSSLENKKNTLMSTKKCPYKDAGKIVKRMK